MTTFEEKVNAYRENKRLIEELEAMNDAVKAEIIDMMHGAPEMVQGVRLDSKLLQAAHPDIYAECSKKTVYKRFSVV